MKVLSVVNLTQSRYYQEGFGYLAQQLNFLEELTFHPSTFEETIHPSHPGYAGLMKHRETMYQFTLSEVRVIYTDTSDFNKTLPLYMAYNESDIQKERSQILIKLKVLYEIFGLKMIDNELSDYLPLMLQFLHITSWYNDPHIEDNIRLVIMVTEDGTYEMANQLAKENNPYAYMVRALRETLGVCLDIPKEMIHHA